VADAERSRRLRAAVVCAPPDALRKATSSITEEVIRALPGPARPLANQLRRSDDPASLLRKLPQPMIVSVLADVLSDECLHATRDALGDAADDPTREQLDAALETVLETFDVATVRIMLAEVASGEAEAADKCDAILAEDPRFALPDDVLTPAAAPRGVRSGPSEDVLAKRRERKEAEKAARAAKRGR
jgi:hypothetical protein